MIAVSVILMLTGFSTTGCENASAPSAKPRIVCTVSMVSDIVRQIVGDQAEVLALIGEGVDPHLYKPTRNDIAAMQSADVIFYSGLMLEGKMGETLEKLSAAGKRVVAVTQRIDAAYLLGWPDSPGHHDPHVWMDASAWSRCVAVVAAELGEWRPAAKQQFAASAERLQGELEKLHAYAKEVLATVPEKSRTLITAHDAFHYFGRAYGLEVLGIQGISTESEAGLKDLERLVNTIVERDIKAVFVESSVSEKNIRALLEGAKARGKAVAIGGTLFSDAMGPAGAYEGTYVGMIDHNVTTIARALGGQAPARGMNGKLSQKE